VSDENVQAMRRMLDAWNRGDIDEWASGFDDEIVWYPLAENPQTEPIHGIEAVREFVSDWLEPWEAYTVDITRIIDQGDWVVVAARHDARHESGAEISMDMYLAAAYREGKGVEARWFMDEADALRVAGIEPPSE
jgi:ketosteroid isomerase-like protein